MKKRLLGFNIFVSVMIFATASFAQNQFANADMEDCPEAANVAPTSWTGYSDNETGQIDCDYWGDGTDPGVYAGAYSPRTQHLFIEGVSQTVNTTVGTLYYVSFHVAGNGGTAEIRLGSAEGDMIGSATITGAYFPVKGTFIAEEDSTTLFLLTDLSSAATGDARIDDACVSSTPNDCGFPEPVCGDGTVDAGEACDDGNTESGDGCNSTCTSDETCGNGFVDDSEFCDDGNVDDGDGCSADCMSDETCGNGVVDAGEACDDGNTEDGDGCSANCNSNETCGNGVVDPGEECDDGNDVDDDECTNACAFYTEAEDDDDGCGCVVGQNRSPQHHTPLLIILGMLFAVAVIRRRYR